MMVECVYHITCLWSNY